MVRYEKYILNRLLDSYESSLLFTGKNKVNISVSFVFNRKNMPEYFDESSLAFEEIHAALNLLEQNEFIRIIWKKKDHIVQKVLLNESCLEEIYRYIKRTSKAQYVANILHLLEKLHKELESHTAHVFISYLCERIRNDQSVKEYIELDKPDKVQQLVKAVTFVEENTESCYIREFSIRHFGDSKVFESMLPMLGKIMRQFGTEYADMDNYAILAEHQIYHTPDYVYIKGSVGKLSFGGSGVVLSDLGQGLGICGDDLTRLRIVETKGIRRVITIENLTTFYRWNEADSLIIYLGGYHNGARRKLLQLIYEEIPLAQYLHFGDIDVGGFEIYEDLRRRTGIPFQTYLMDSGTLTRYEAHAKPLTINDKKRLESILTGKSGQEYRDTLQYMLEKGIKLEQECVQVKKSTGLSISK